MILPFSGTQVARVTLWHLNTLPYLKKKKLEHGCDTGGAEACNNQEATA
jgi:hypothetical protein